MFHHNWQLRIPGGLEFVALSWKLGGLMSEHYLTASSQAKPQHGVWVPEPLWRPLIPVQGFKEETGLPGGWPTKETVKG